MPVVTIGGRKVFVVPEGPTLKTPHIPIYIDDNSAFTKENGVVSGSGTSTNPYIIENWDIMGIETGYGFEIRTTNSHFIIRNCVIHKKSDGIHFFEVENGKIENCTIYNNGADGIWINKSYNNNIISNNIYNNNRGISLHDSRDNEIHYNNIYSNRALGVYNEGFKDPADAVGNWWGDESGPRHKSNPNGNGNRVSPNVVFDPWLKKKY